MSEKVKRVGCECIKHFIILSIQQFVAFYKNSPINQNMHPHWSNVHISGV